MKRYVFIFVIFIFGLSVYAQTFTAYRRQEKIPLFPERKTSPTLDISLNLIRISGNTAIQNTVNAVLYNRNSVEAYVHALINARKKNYEESAVFYDDDFSDSANWNYSQTIEASNFPKIIQIKNSFSEYTGGAHENYGVQHVVINKQNAKQLLITDIINDSNTMKKLITTALVSNKNITLFSTDIEIPHNFLFTNDGIKFQWNPYDIAPYSQGIVEIVIPYTAIQKILTTQGRTIIADFEKR
ncbi:MAG: RsiV family protein [Treponema sp.]|jgi:hypothetical protein|nr:RsiV family protein [Treponema sp.]